MFYFLIALWFTPSLAQATTPVQIPDAMRAKWEEVSKTVATGYENARTRIDEVGREELGQELKRKVHAARKSSFGESVAEAASRVWAMAKQKGRGVLVVLDHQLHEKVLGPENQPANP